LECYELSEASIEWSVTITDDTKKGVSSAVKVLA
jgi:hypothetical protein